MNALVSKRVAGARMDYLSYGRNYMSSMPARRRKPLIRQNHEVARGLRVDWAAVEILSIAY
jgi:hypothetical protein